MNWLRLLLNKLLGQPKWEEREKYKDFNWPAISDYGNNLRKKGYELRWVSQKSLEASKLNGWEICYTKDNKNTIHYRILNSANQVLMKKLHTNK